MDKRKYGAQLASMLFCLTSLPQTLNAEPSPASKMSATQEPQTPADAKPADTASMRQLAVSQAAEGRFGAALDIIEQAQAIAPLDNDIALARARILLWSGRVSEARIQADVVRNLAPAYPDLEALEASINASQAQRRARSGVALSAGAANVQLDAGQSQYWKNLTVSVFTGIGASTNATATIEHERRRANDTKLSLLTSRTGSNWELRAGVAVTPSADFREKWGLQSGADVQIHNNVTLLSDVRYADYGNISVVSANCERTLPFLLTKQSRFDDLPLQAASLAGVEIWWAISGSPVFEPNQKFVGFRGSGIDITERRRNLSDTSRQATYDSLTGLLNRFQMSKLLETTLSGFKHQNRVCSIMLIDLDRFKQVNDSLGHPAGDILLKQVADRLVRVVGDREKISRLGGDEFQIILPDVEDRGILGELADRIIHSLSQPYMVDGSRCVIGASVGIVVSPFDGQNREELVRNADLALYAAKGNGRGRFRFYSYELLRAAEERRGIEDDLRDALGKNEITLAYQPVVDAQTNTVTGFEALIRWNHPERGPVSPAVFIPIAEEAGLIGSLGEWALHAACRDAAEWPGKIRVAVNVSPVQFANNLLPQIIESALLKSGLPPDRLELEITEGVFLEESSDTDQMFLALKKLGVRLALDDFGTGYSSLGYLRTAPFDKIKIDQSFVRTATEPGSRNSAIIAAIVALAQALNMETTAEGIESLDQLDLIRKLNVSHVQGYVYSKPVANEILLAQCQAGDWIIPPSGPAVTRGDRYSMYRKIAVIHENHCYNVILRNLSTTGALIEGLVNVPIGTNFVLDFGEGQLAISTVVRSMGHQQGLHFEEPLVNDGNGGLCTSRRISSYMLAAAGMPTTTQTSDNFDPAEGKQNQKILPAFGMAGGW